MDVLESFILSIHTNYISNEYGHFLNVEILSQRKEILTGSSLAVATDTSKVEIDGNCFYQSIKRRKQCFLSLALILNQRNQLNDYNF
jgi:hypothetical protein